MERCIAIEWRDGIQEGTVELHNVELVDLTAAEGTADVRRRAFRFAPGGPCRLLLRIETRENDIGASAGRVSVTTPQNPFTFFLRDVSPEYPIVIRDIGVLVTEGNDERSFEAVDSLLHRAGRLTKLQQTEIDPEESFATAAANTVHPHCPIWLGVSRDIRIFDLVLPEGHPAMVQPRLHGMLKGIPEWDGKAVQYQFEVGRGSLCERKVTRRLESGVLPIVRATVVDEDITYDVTAFVGLENSLLAAGGVRGIHYLVAAAHGIGYSYTEEQEKERRLLQEDELLRDEETVLFIQIDVVNAGSVPRYAWFKGAEPMDAHVQEQGPNWRYEEATGFGRLESGRVFCVSKLDGSPLPQQEMAVLLKPGEAVAFELAIPHAPVSEARAVALRAADFGERLTDCVEFWNGKLESVARIRVPEKRITEMTQAGLLHLDLVAYGLEPDGPVAASTGQYCPIGSESSPLIQFMDSMGMHGLARRSLEYFLELQRENGFIQSFSGYMLETGAVLWSLGEHYRYTRDDTWAAAVASKVLKACNFLLEWRKSNKREDLKGAGYGLIEGSVADPKDPYRQFMLNGYAYLGIVRAAEMLENVRAAESVRLREEAEQYRNDIRTALLDAAARSPVVPVGDGTWCPTVPPWAEAIGPVALFAEEGDWYSLDRQAFYRRTGAHFWVRDSMLGPLYLVFHEIVEPDEQMAEWMLSYHSELMLRRNVASTQPYYSRHPWIHLKRGEVKAFLKAYYNGLASQADRETYTFPEGLARTHLHIERDSLHKTHEEGWFL
ncbi:MAG: hypothetical protein CL878_06705, partial [Dehalococcoidia bacterium]|nr:hypothetical protein [Dehalococcoidia bacterium]